MDEFQPIQILVAAPDVSELLAKFVPIPTQLIPSYEYAIEFAVLVP
jgi:hypothetical protein